MSASVVSKKGYSKAIPTLWQGVPGTAPTAVQDQMPFLLHLAKMLLECVAARACQFDHDTDCDATMFAGVLDDGFGPSEGVSEWPIQCSTEFLGGVRYSLSLEPDSGQTSHDEAKPF